MPEMQFSIRWPDGARSLCYSPSLVIEEHLSVGTCYGLADFLARVRTALIEASARVQRIYGMPCSLALDQLAQIEQRAGGFASDTAVTVLEFRR
ncbi:MSMEG_0570 family nitrogen starvation response protein [Lichenicoccus sp.]|uniref:MSMEG_0570 family nitrogen starvation response protein n=1 Tax=Lichenicoccus sp. TaxID=2781899 RepID=UPI003D0F2C61